MSDPKPPAASSATSRADGAVVVTGAAGGIGSVLAEQLLREGNRVLLTDLDGARLEALSTAQHPNAEVVTADAADEAGWNAIVDRVRDRFGGIVGLANVAGHQGRAASVAETERSNLELAWERNVQTAFLGIQAVWPHLVEAGGGAVVNVASYAGLRGVPKFAPYAAAKHAVVGLTRTAALEGAPLGIRVNAVCPGPAETAMMEAVVQSLVNRGDAERLRQRMAGANPMGRFATPHEVAEVIDWLLSRRSSYVTGAVVPVDGGLTAS